MAAGGRARYHRRGAIRIPVMMHTLVYHREAKTMGPINRNAPYDTANPVELNAHKNPGDDPGSREERPVTRRQSLISAVVYSPVWS